MKNIAVLIALFFLTGCATVGYEVGQRMYDRQARDLCRDNLSDPVMYTQYGSPYSTQDCLIGVKRNSDERYEDWKQRQQREKSDQNRVPEEKSSQ